jgi:hypothetical protein
MIDSFRRMFEKKTEEELGVMAQKFEDDLLVNAKEFAKTGKSGIVILPGVERMFREVRAGPNAEEHYAICTSGEYSTLMYHECLTELLLSIPGFRVRSAANSRHCSTLSSPHLRRRLKGEA